MFLYELLFEMLLDFFLIHIPWCQVVLIVFQHSFLLTFIILNAYSNRFLRSLSQLKFLIQPDCILAAVSLDLLLQDNCRSLIGIKFRWVWLITKCSFQHSRSWNGRCNESSSWFESASTYISCAFTLMPLEPLSQKRLPGLFLEIFIFLNPVLHRVT